MDVVRFLNEVHDEDVGVVERKDRIVRIRINPLNEYDDADFINRYRFSKRTVEWITLEVQGGLVRHRNRAETIQPINQVLVFLRFLATGGFLRLIGDAFGIHITTVSRLIRTVAQCIAQLKHRFIQFPTGNTATMIQEAFMTLGNIPGVVGAVDCTHIPIISPGGRDAELFRNRKNFFSINVQAICDSSHRFTNIVARWPGSTHDARIFDNSEISAKFERREYQ